jgi:predicted Zn-dependent protease
MATVYVDGGYGYAATGDTSTAGLREALERAAHWARSTAKLALFDSRTLPRPAPCGEYVSPSFADRFPTRREWYELLAEESVQAGCDPRIVDWEAAVDVLTATHRLVTSTGGDVIQRYRFLLPGIPLPMRRRQRRFARSMAIVDLASKVEPRCWHDLPSWAAAAGSRRKRSNCFRRRTARAARWTLLAPDQMILQIHESIGHPLELDRILGDERNFAGTSFVTPDMFGSYRYGSELLNVTFDPTRPEELASYAYDDDGTRAERVHLIRAGVLERPLGGAISQARAGLAGVANSRATSWNRPPIDHGQPEPEPGDATLEEMIAGIERGVLMETNSSWSIDDSRNKFQFDANADK